MALTEEQAELIRKLQEHASREAGGAKLTPDVWRALFYKYDRNRDGYISPGELVTLLEDADYSNFLFRRMAAATIVDKVDAAGKRDGAISLEEFMTALQKLGDPSMADMTSDGIKRMKRLVEKEFVPEVPSFGDGGGMLLLLGIGALVLLSGKR